jgi:hypothetical protein
MNWEIEIEKVQNGYVCKWWEEADDDELVKGQRVFEEQDSARGDLDAFVSLCWFLAEHFGVYGSKHDEFRLRCEVVNQREGADENVE